METFPYTQPTNCQSGIVNWQRGEKANEEQTVSAPLSFSENIKLFCLHLKHCYRDSIKRIATFNRNHHFEGDFPQFLIKIAPCSQEYRGAITHLITGIWALSSNVDMFSSTPEKHLLCSAGAVLQTQDYLLYP